MKNKVGITLLVLIISGCLVISAGLVVGAFFLFRAQKNYVQPTVVVTEAPGVDAQMDQIQADVEGIRGLEMNAALDRALMTTSELQEVVVNDFFKDYTDEEARQDSLVLSTLGLVEYGFDLLPFYKDLYTEQIAGFYDSEVKEMYVIADGTFGGLERMTYAHEFTHVLQDQNYDLENGLKLNDDHCEVETEYCAAVSALVEGDATLTEQYWFLQHSTDQDKNQVSEFQQNYSSPVFDSAPYYMKSDFLFPYVQGFEFVNQLYGKNKWKSVDEAYANPPVSTEQILHPEKYPLEVPAVVDLPDLLPDLPPGWIEIDKNVMGEWYTSLILSSSINEDYRLSETTAQDAADGWGGDTYGFYADQDLQNFLFAWRSTWDTREDADEFYAASLEYGKKRWGEPVEQNGQLVTWFAPIEGYITINQIYSDVMWLVSNSSEAFQGVTNMHNEFGY